MRVASIVVLWLGVLLNTTEASAEKISLVGNFVEGGMVIGQTEPQAEVWLDDTSVPVNEAGRFVLGFHRDSPDTMTLTIALPNGENHENILTIAQRDYHVQAIDGLANKYVTPDPAVIDRIKNDAKMVRGVRDQFSPLEYFTEEWVWPATGIITGVFGSQRVLNGKPSAPHYGIDIAIPEGTLVMAPTSGTVTLVEDLYYSGLTVMIDHGMGISSTLLHLRDSLVTVCQTVRGGEFIALSGNSGRSSGPHLDWRVNWGNHARLDAALLVPDMPSSE